MLVWWWGWWLVGFLRVASYSAGGFWICVVRIWCLWGVWFLLVFGFLVLVVGVVVWFGCVVGFPGKLDLCCFVVCLLWAELVIAGLGLMVDLLFVLCVVAFWVGVPVRFGTR